MVEIVVLRALCLRAVACEVRAAGTVRVRRVECTLATRLADRLRSICALARMSATEMLARQSILR